MSEGAPGRDAGATPARPRPAPNFPDHATPQYSVRQAADLLGVQPAFLRRLDALHVVTPARSPGGQRRYSEIEILRIHAVTELLDQGVTLVGAQRIIELQAEVAALRERIAELTDAERPDRFGA